MEWSQVIVLSVVIVGAQIAFNDGGQEIEVNKSGTGPIDPLTLEEVDRNLEEYTGTEIKVAGNAKNDSGDIYLTGRGHRLDIRSCKVEEGEVQVRGTLSKNVKCECVYKDRIYGWRNDSPTYQSKPRCLNNYPDLYTDSSCINGSENTNYFLKCGN